MDKSNFWAVSSKELLKVLKSDALGLDNKQVELRTRTFGKNEIESTSRLSRARIFIRQFQSPIIYILLIAAGITLLLQDYKDASFILIAAIINAGLGFYQENKAETALEKLESYIDDKTLVRRSGQEFKISSKEVVPGDIIVLKSGSKIPADARLISLNDLYTDEAVLTGETLAQEKGIENNKEETPLGDRTCCVFAGTVVTQGYGSAVVINTGRLTEIGRIASLVSAQIKERTPLQKALQSLSIKASWIVLALATLIFFLAYSSETGFLDSFLISVAVLVAAVPEGLPIVMTIILATGVQRLAKKNGVVRKLNAAETLGSTSVILTDKTGTLTQAKMKLSEIVCFEDNKSEKLGKQVLLELALLNTDVNIENPKDDPGNWRVNGKSLEQALTVQAAQKYRVFLPDLKKEKEELDFLPFNSRSKYSATSYKTKLPNLVQFFQKTNLSISTATGAPEILIAESKNSDSEKKEYLDRVEKLAYEGARVIAVSYSISDKAKKLNKTPLSGKKMLGLIAFKDPVKSGVKAAMQEVSRAGVRTIIVTGDHTGTAISVAKEIGMDIKGDEAIEGRELDDLTDNQLRGIAKKLKLVSRVSPEGKMRLAKALQANGEVVAMNGDGVNDAPAIKQADIGIAMGSGTDVAKQAADLVLLDDNYETIVEAIKEGHRIVQNIRKALVYLSSTILDEVVLIGASIIAGIALPFNALQILWVNFFADSFPGISLAFEDRIDPIESRPTSIQDGLFTKEMKFLLFVNGTVSSILLLALYLVLLNINIDETLARTVTFTAFGSYSLILVLSLRSLKKSILNYNPFSNQALNISLVVGFALIAVSIYIPFFQRLFGTVAISSFWVGIVLLFGILNILLIELTKLIFRKG